MDESSQAQTRSTPPHSPLQSELQDAIGAEINEQTYEFASNTVAKMLSPKRLIKRPKGMEIPQPSLNDFKYLIDEPAVKDAMQFPELAPLKEHTGWNQNSEAPNYAPLVAFLNQCVEICDDIYDSIDLTKLHQLKKRNPKPTFRIVGRARRWLPHLRFMVYDRPTREGIHSAKPLKPDFVGVDDAEMQGEKDVVCCWSPPSPDASMEKKGKDIRNLQIKVAGEVKAGWSEMVKQAGTYARGMFTASPLRSFALVIAFNHTKQELRYLIFHHGGLSASKALKLADPSDCRGIVKILLSVLLWQSPADAGLPRFTDGHEFCLPEPFKGVFNVDRVLYQTLSIRGRNTYVARLQQPRTKASKQSAIPDTKSTDRSEDTLSRSTPRKDPPWQFRRTTIASRATTQCKHTASRPTVSLIS
ncbi:MAG TPA: hypothetical protein VM842_01655 [Nitrospira sp.]|nr:hypothetical protein [Nitrospira sp.]